MIGKIIYSLLNGVISIYPRIAPQGKTGTYAVYNITSVTPTNVKQSASVVDTFYVQIDVFASTPDLARTAADTIRSTIDYYQGTVATYKVNLIRYENENDSYEIDTDTYMISTDYFIRVKK